MKIRKRFTGSRVRAAVSLLAACTLGLAGAGAVAAPGAAAATSPCTVAYSVVNSWPGGFQAGITITNNGAPLTSWSLAFTFPGDQQISGGWNGTYSQNGQDVTVTSESWNGALGTGASATIGFTGTAGPSNGVPGYFTVNGFACNGAAQLPSVEITSPAAGQVYAPGSDVPVTAAASEPTASITKVEFFAASTLPGTSHTPVLIGTAAASPYTLTWASVPAGYYDLTAEAFDSAGATATSAPMPVSVVPATSTAPQLHVSGNQLVDASGSPVELHGVDRSGGEFACVQGNGIWNGPMDQASIGAMKSWGVTAVRVPLNEACWNAESYVNAAYAGTAYQDAVKAYVSLLNNNGIVAILDLHWTDGAYTGPSAGCSSAQATCQKPMPDAAQAVPFWTSVASTFKGNNAVIFDLFNEPYASRATGDATSGWQCWLAGGTCPGISYQVAGMQSLVNAVRSTGAANVIMLGGEEYSNDLTGWLAHEPTDPDHNLAVSWHSYNFNTCSTLSCWTSQVAPVAAQVPVIAGEIGENDCADGYLNSLLPWLDSGHISYLAWTWNNWDCSQGPALITSYSGAPTAFGAGYEAHLQSLAGGSGAAAPARRAARPVQAAQPRPATGDSRAVSQPAVPATCTTLDAQLATGNEQFSSAAESSPPDTSRLQAALNSCAGSGKAVVLAASGSSNAFLSGPLTVPGGVTLLVNDGVTLYASRNPANYQVSGAPVCGTVASSGNGCKPFITVTGSSAAIMGTRGGSGGQGIIDGRGGQDILGTSTTWWGLAQQAKTSGGKQNNPRLIEAHGVNNLTVSDVDLVNAPIFHLYYEGGSGLTVWGVRIKTPATARNTDGIDADSATNVTVSDSYISDGDDGIAIKTNSGPASAMTVENSHFYGTHGMSIGSETQHGVSNILFMNDTVSGVDSAGTASTDNNGIRIKTDSSVGGTVQQVTYQNICLSQVKHAMVFNPFYASGNGSTTPFFTGITVGGLKAVSSASGAQSVLEGYNASHPLGLTLENVSLDATSSTAEFANIGVFSTNLAPSGTDVTVMPVSGSGSVPSCSFPPYPGL